MSEPVEHVLLVEDNGDDVFFLRRAVRKAGVPWKLAVVMDGQAALDYVAGAGEYANREAFPIPSLIFLDLKLPYVGGFDLLPRIRSDQAFGQARVIVLTSSPEERDRNKAMELGADAYLIKPPTADDLRAVAGARPLAALA